VVVLWAASGPIVGWSDTWQLIINTGTTIVTFLMVFVIQNTQSRDTQAMQLKLDELVSNVSFIRRSDEFLESIKKGGRTSNPSLMPNSLLAGKIQGILPSRSPAAG
jgi:Low affinity iron permease